MYLSVVLQILELLVFSYFTADEIRTLKKKLPQFLYYFSHSTWKYEGSLFKHK